MRKVYQMIKIRILTIVFLLFGVFCLAQTTLTGKVKNSEGQPVSSASVTLEEVGKDAILAYGITDAKGNFKIAFSSDVQKIDIKIKAFNYRLQQKQIKNENQYLEFSLQSEATEIKEVVLKSKIIHKKGDTLSYDLKAFEAKNDRTLSDVLKRMPGIEVNKDGSVLYQGQPLSKFYVEGKDLMEGGYGVVNNSLPKDAVAKVEVMENHQPVKILQGKVPAEQAALNIKLKNRVTMTGRGEVGLGIANPALWNVKMTPMFFSKKTQWLANYKTNNIGETVETEGGIFGMGVRWEGRRSNASQDNWLSVQKASTPSLPEKRYLFNNVHYLSGNILVNPFKNKEWELKAIASYTNNVVERGSEVETKFKTNNVLSVNKIENNFYTNKAKAELIFTKNAKKGFFKNTTTFNKFWNADRAFSNFNMLSSQQALESPTVSFQNSLSTIIPIKNKMFNVMSYLSYQDDRQDLFVTPGYYVILLQGGSNKFANEEKIWQKFNSKSFVANHSASVGFNVKGITLMPEIGYNYTQNNINTDLLGFHGGQYHSFEPNFSNQLRYQNSVPYATLGINYKTDTWSFNVNSPLNFNQIYAQDPLRFVNKNFSKTTFEPSAFIQYSFSFWKAIATGNIKYNFADASRLYGGNILQNAQYIGYMNSQNPLLENFIRTAGTRLEYRNPLNNLFFNINYSFSKSTSNLIANPLNNNTGYNVLTFIEQDNSTVSHSQSAEMGKYFPKFKSNLSLSFRNSNGTSENYLDNRYFVNKNSTQSTGLKLSNSYFSWLTFDYNYSMTWGKNVNQNAVSQNYRYIHGLTATVFPIDGHSLAFNWDQINTKQANFQFKNGFYDLTYQFAWIKKRIDFELKWLNIANRNIFETVSDFATQTTVSKINIRPSQVMVSVKFNFK